MKVAELLEFIKRRHAIFLKRNAGKKKPWTDDKILQRFKFCNVYRELDTVTMWIAQHWRTPLIGNPDLWFAMSVARWVNWPPTLYAIGIPVPWKKDKFIRVLRERSARHEKVWTGAYMIGTQGHAMDKNLFIAESVLNPLWQEREYLRPRPDDTLATFAARVIAVKNQGRFMVGQMIADAKYADNVLMECRDWHTFAVSGPGSRRGMNRVFNRDVHFHWNEDDWHRHLMMLQEAVNPSLPQGWEKLHAQDLQNCLCEFDKYERVRLGQGRPRSLYQGV